jgi:hypothetical protein
VISSTWRYGQTIEGLQNELGLYGFKGEIVGLTSQLEQDFCTRGNEIYKWMIENSEYVEHSNYTFCNYIILDDESDLLYNQKDNFIQIDPYVGLTPFTIRKAIDILNA